jgi:hypothetical protein
MHHPSDDDRHRAGQTGGYRRDRVRGNASRSRLALVTLGCMLVGCGAARAQVSVDGRPDAVHIETREATLREVFDALRTKFDLRYRTDDALEARRTGIFDGPLPRVTARMLEGYDFAMKVTAEGIDVLVLRRNQVDVRTVASATPAPLPPKGPPAPAMSAAQANRYEREHFR